LGNGKAKRESDVSDQWYFAYGSNLARDQKVSRSGPIREKRRAQLNGYRIAFNKRGIDGTGKANIVPEPGVIVWGVVFRCTPNALREIDRFEGVSGGHYFRKMVRVRVDGGENLDAVTYLAGNTFIDDSLSPNPKYLQTVLQGAREHDLPEDYICAVEMMGN
jgi:cation transport regulator ChaC